MANLTHSGSVIYIVAPERGQTQKNFLEKIAKTSLFEVKVNPCGKFNDLVNARITESEADRIPKLIEIIRRVKI